MLFPDNIPAPHPQQVSLSIIYNAIDFQSDYSKAFTNQPKLYKIALDDSFESKPQDATSANSDDMTVSEAFPYEPSRSTTQTIILSALLGKHIPAKLPQKAAFSVDETLAEYLALPEQSFASFPDAQIFTFMPDDKTLIPAVYLPPSKHKPVMILSMGSKGRLVGYAPFIRHLHEKGYGVLAYEYALLDPTGHHISDAKISFNQLETKLTKDLNDISQALAAGSFKTTKGHHSIEPIPYQKHVFVGHSTGGYLSANIMVDHPERVYPVLFLIATPRSFNDAVQNIMKDEVYHWIYRLIPRKRASSVFQGSFDLRLSLPHIKSPIVFIQGTQDHLVRQDGKSLYAMIANKTNQFIIIPKAEHINIIYTEKGISFDTNVVDYMNKILEGIK